MEILLSQFSKVPPNLYNLVYQTSDYFLQLDELKCAQHAKTLYLRLTIMNNSSINQDEIKIAAKYHVFFKKYANELKKFNENAASLLQRRAGYKQAKADFNQDI